MTEPTKVLCFFKYRRLKLSIWRTDTFMLEVDTSDQIYDAFINRILRCRYHDWEFLSYLPENGRRTF